MGKRTLVVYSCDRCGKKIIDALDEPASVWRLKFLHVFRWFVPVPTKGYPLRYICKDCFESFKAWYLSERKAGDRNDA